jgi:hypothetical protein
MEYDKIIFEEYSERTEHRIKELKREKELINKELFILRCIRHNFAFMNRKLAKNEPDIV